MDSTISCEKLTQHIIWVPWFVAFIKIIKNALNSLEYKRKTRIRIYLKQILKLNVINVSVTTTLQQTNLRDLLILHGSCIPFPFFCCWPKDILNLHGKQDNFLLNSQTQRKTKMCDFCIKLQLKHNTKNTKQTLIAYCIQQK